MNREYLIEKGFEEKRVGCVYYFQLGYVCLRFDGLGSGQFIYEYLAGSLVLYKKITTKEDVEFLINFLN